jgi:hypothetical protein
MKRLLSGLAASILIAVPHLAAAAPAAPTPHWKWAITVNPDSVNIGEAEDDEENSISCDLPPKKLIGFHFHVDGATLNQQIKTQMTVVSGAAKVVVKSDGDPNEDAGGVDVFGQVAAGSPVVTNFGATGELKMTALGHTSSSPVVPKAMAARLVKLCRG